MKRQKELEDLQACKFSVEEYAAHLEYEREHEGSVHRRWFALPYAVRKHFMDRVTKQYANWRLESIKLAQKFGCILVIAFCGFCIFGHSDDIMHLVAGGKPWSKISLANSNANYASHNLMTHKYNTCNTKGEGSLTRLYSIT